MSGCCTYFKYNGREYFVNTASLLEHEGRVVLIDTGIVLDIDLHTSNLPSHVGHITKFDHAYTNTSHQIATALGGVVANLVQ